MIQNIKNFLKIFGVHIVVHKIRNLYQKMALSGQSRKEIFTDIYKNNMWNGSESISGQGSDLVETQELLKQLPEFFKKYHIKKIIDLPCGDYNWLRYLEYEFDHYTGIDIVDDIIASNKIKFGNQHVQFLTKDCLQDDIGHADLIFCRDLLIHFSQQDVFKFFKNICRADVDYLLTTHFIDEKNSSIVTGQWCPVNLMAPPYNLPEPVDYIVENTKMFDGRYAKTKTMALWRIADIKSVLDK